MSAFGDTIRGAECRLVGRSRGPPPHPTSMTGLERRRASAMRDRVALPAATRQPRGDHESGNDLCGGEHEQRQPQGTLGALHPADQDRPGDAADPAERDGGADAGAAQPRLVAGCGEIVHHRLRAEDEEPRARHRHEGERAVDREGEQDQRSGGAEEAGRHHRDPVDAIGRPAGDGTAQDLHRHQQGAIAERGLDRRALVQQDRGKPGGQPVQAEQAERARHPDRDRRRAVVAIEQRRDAAGLLDDSGFEPAGVPVQRRPIRAGFRQDRGDPRPVAARRQIAHRFGQHGMAQQRDQQRRGPDEIKRVPAEIGGEREPGDAGEDAAEREGQDEGDRRVAIGVARRRPFVDVDKGDRRQHAERDPEPGAQRAEHDEAVREEGERQAGEPEQPDPREHHAPPPEAIGERPLQQGADREPGDAERQHQADLLAGEAPLRLDVGRDIGGVEQIVAVDEQHRPDQRRKPDMRAR